MPPPAPGLAAPPPPHPAPLPPRTPRAAPGSPRREGDGARSPLGPELRRALPAAPGHPPGTAHFPAAAPSAPSPIPAPGCPGRGRRRGRRRAVRAESGEPSGLDLAREIPRSPKWKVFKVARKAGGGVGLSGRAQRRAGGRGGGGAGRTATLGRQGFPSGVSLLPTLHPPPPPTSAGTSGLADWLMGPWKRLLKKISQTTKMCHQSLLPNSRGTFLSCLHHVLWACYRRNPVIPHVIYTTLL